MPGGGGLKGGMESVHSFVTFSLWTASQISGAKISRSSSCQNHPAVGYLGAWRQSVENLTLLSGRLILVNTELQTWGCSFCQVLRNPAAAASNKKLCVLNKQKLKGLWARISRIIYSFQGLASTHNFEVVVTTRLKTRSKMR